MRRATSVNHRRIRSQLLARGGARPELPAVSDAGPRRRRALHARRRAGAARRRAGRSTARPTSSPPGLHRAFPSRLHGPVHEHALHEQRDAGATSRRWRSTLRPACSSSARSRGSRRCSCSGTAAAGRRRASTKPSPRTAPRTARRPAARAVHRRTRRAAAGRRDRLRGRASRKPGQRAARAQPVGDRRAQSTVAARELRLDPFDPKNGFNPNGNSHYSADFQRRYYAAQSSA